MPRAAEPLPLLCWPDLTEIALLEEARQEMMRRIAALPRFSHRRVLLEQRLRELTSKQIAVHNAMRGST